MNPIGMIPEGLCSWSSFLKPYLIVETRRGLTGEPQIVLYQLSLARHDQTSDPALV